MEVIIIIVVYLDLCFECTFDTTVKPLLSGHPREIANTLNTGCPLKTGYLIIRLKRAILKFLSIKRP